MDSKFEMILNVQSAKIEKLEKENEEIVKNLKALKGKLEKDENTITDKTLEGFKCSKCDFKSNSEHGLKVHTTRKHTNLENENIQKCVNSVKRNLETMLR